jgi:hypothetical protein
VKIIASQSERWLSEENVDYRMAVDFIRHSKELLEALSIVYNTPEKIQVLVDRIIA